MSTRYGIIACRPGRCIRLNASSVEAANTAATFMRGAGWVVTCLEALS